VEPDDDCYAALKMVAVDGWDESEGALYFESASASTWHRENLMYLFTHGNHDFYTEREGEQG
jgi:N-acetylmuramoyl-L-alanine amidase